MRPVALAVVLSLVATGCFPENARYRTYSKVGEGVALTTGIVLLAVSTTSADCGMGMVSGINDSSCKSHASTVGGIGLALILAGLGGFIATVSTTPDDKTPTIEIKAPPASQPPTVATPPPATSQVPPPAPTPGT